MSIDVPSLANARAIDPLTLSSVQVQRLSREIRASQSKPDVRIAFAGNIVFEPLAEFVETHLACRGMTAASYMAPFAQAAQEFLDPHSALHEFRPDFVVLHFELDEILPALLERNPNGELRRERTQVSEVLALITPSVRASLQATDATVLLTNFAGPDCYDLGIADSKSEFGQQELFAHLNLELAHQYRNEPRVQIVDLCRLSAYYGRGRARDRRLYYLGKMPWHEGFLPLLADELVRHVEAASGRIRKCLVVDLDNTLWAGVLGEDGPLGVLVGPGDPAGEAHLGLQRRIRGLRKRGILLAMCSKNNPEDVEAVFRLRPDMPLRREDFACAQIGWNMKHEALQKIAATLNIGTDSLVFLDDNPAEIDLVRRFMPEVECVLVPRDPAALPTCLDRVHGLDRTVITTEDVMKTVQYQDNTAREFARQDFSDLRDYLQSLRTRVTIQSVSPASLPRAQQLFAKTNQFNLTKQRYSLGELERLSAGRSDRVLIARARDRFGDLGWIGAVVLRSIDGPDCRIENFVLSCRAMGRAIETAMLNHVKRLCFERFERASVSAAYVPSGRNMPVSELYERQGFTVVERGEDGCKYYRLERSDQRACECDHIDVEED